MKTDWFSSMVVDSMALVNAQSADLFRHVSAERAALYRTLAVKMRDHGVAVHEEAQLDVLLADIAKNLKLTPI